MKNQFPNRLEVFLALALKQAGRENAGAENSDFMLASKPETEENAAEKFPVIYDYLSESETEIFQRVWADYQNKNAAEKADWKAQIIEKIGTDEDLIDEQVHRSHINEALQKEIPAVQKIIAGHLPNSYKKSTDTFTGKKKKPSPTAELKPPPNAENDAGKSRFALEKTIRRRFAEQFVALRDLKNPTAFDRLSGTHLARLIRLTGISEVATACVRIEAVESVAAFLRIFSAEDAQAIAAQLNSLAETSDARLAFAEHLVQTTLEAEPQPSAMLDLLGICLIGVSLCGASDVRVQYTNQKLPLEIASKLPEIIDEQCRKTPEDLQKQISREIERLAETLVSHGKAK